MSSESEVERIRALEVTAVAYKNDIEELKTDVKYIREVLARLDGSKRTLIALLSGAAGMGALLSWLLNTLIMHK